MVVKGVSRAVSQTTHDMSSYKCGISELVRLYSVRFVISSADAAFLFLGVLYSLTKPQNALWPRLVRPAFSRNDRAAISEAKGISPAGIYQW